MNTDLIQQVVADQVAADRLYATGLAMQITTAQPSTPGPGNPPSVSDRISDRERASLARRFGHPGTVSDAVALELHHRARAEDTAQAVRMLAELEAPEETGPIPQMSARSTARVPTGEDEPITNALPRRRPVTRRRSWLERAFFGRESLPAQIIDTIYAQSAAAATARVVGNASRGMADTIEIFADFNDWFSRNAAELVGWQLSDPNLSRNRIGPIVTGLREYGETTIADSIARDVPEDQRNLGTAVASVVAETGSQVALSFVNPKLALATLFGQGVSKQEDLLRKAGVDMNSVEAKAGKILGGLTTMVQEALGIRSIKRFSPFSFGSDKAGDLERALRSGSAEAITEAMENTLQQLITHFITDEDEDEDLLSLLPDDLLHDGAINFATGGSLNLLLNFMTPGRANRAPSKANTSPEPGRELSGVPQSDLRQTGKGDTNQAVPADNPNPDHTTAVDMALLSASLEDMYPPGTLGSARVWKAKTRIKAVGLPHQGKIRFVPPLNWEPQNPLPKGPRRGYLDRFGNEWVKGPSRTEGQHREWDVQLSSEGRAKLGWISPHKNHLNVSMDGKVTHK